MKNFLIIALLSITFYHVLAQKDSTFLVLNTRMHNKVISIDGFIVDKSSKYILTSSLDKTAKLWDANTGNLLLTFRVPIDDTIEGAFFSGSISPDNKMVAFGGSFSKGITPRLYIFDL